MYLAKYVSECMDAVSLTQRAGPFCLDQYHMRLPKFVARAPEVPALIFVWLGVTFKKVVWGGKMGNIPSFFYTHMLARLPKFSMHLAQYSCNQLPVPSHVCAQL